uniref:Bowman-Birk serine protease inhibitors family domain-containing protein n=1 Tax=Aegilops tauschii subsp. strangulata TaxID=200361 RepID=A0A453HBL7_AEGTS
SMAATMKLTITFLLLVSAALVVFGDAKKAPCAVVCVQGGHITCDNYPGQKLDGCDCQCAPKDGKGCVLHLNSGSTNQCTTTPEY